MVMSMDATSGDQTMTSPMDESTNFNQTSRRQESGDEELNEDEQSKASVQTIVVKTHHQHQQQQQKPPQQQQQLERLDSQKKQPDDSNSAMVVSRESSLDEERKLMMHVDDDDRNSEDVRQTSNRELTTEEQKAFIEAENKAVVIMRQLKQQSAKQASTQDMGRKDPLVARMREIVEGTPMQKQPKKQPKSSNGDSLNNQAENNNKASIESQSQQQLQQQKRSRHTSRTHGCNRHHHHHHHHHHHRPSVTMLNSGLPTTTSSGVSEHQHRVGSIEAHQHGHAHRHHHHHHHHHSHQSGHVAESKRSGSGQRQISTISNDPRQPQDLESTMGEKSTEKNVPTNDTKSSTSSVSSAPQAPPASIPATKGGEPQHPTDSGISGEANLEGKKACPHHESGNGHHHHHHHHHQLAQNPSQHPHHHHHHYHNHHGRHHHHHHKNHKKRLVLDVGNDQQALCEQRQCLVENKGRLLAEDKPEQANSKRTGGESQVLAAEDNGTMVEQEDATETKRAPLQEMNTSNVVDNFCCAYHERHHCSAAGGQLKHQHHHHHNHGHHHHHHHHQLHNLTARQGQKKDTNFATTDEQHQQQVSASQHRHHHHRHHHQHQHHGHHGHHSKQRHKNKHKTSSSSNTNINQEFQDQQQSNIKDTSSSTMINQNTCRIKSSGFTEGATTVCDEASVIGREDFDSESKMHLDNEESGDDRTRNIEDQGKRTTADQFSVNNNKASNEVVTMDMSPYNENKTHRETDVMLVAPSAESMVAEVGDRSGDLDKNQPMSLSESASLSRNDPQLDSNNIRQQQQENKKMGEKGADKDNDSGCNKQNEKDAIRQASDHKNYELARNQEGDNLREVQDNLSHYNGNNSSSNNNKQASNQRLVRQMSSSRENSQKEFVGSAGAGGGNKRQQSQQQEQLHIECLPETYQQDQQQASQPKQIIQSTVPPDRRCRLCWCCCCPCSGLSNKSNAIKTEVKPAIEQPSSSTNKCLSVPNVPLEEIRMWGDSFDRLMKCPDGRKIFQDFLRCEYSEENILFWIACEELKSEKDAKSIATKARDIYEDYISILSAKEVSLDSRVRDVINNNIKKPTSNIFDEAQLQIYTLMHRDSYPRFINSPMYKKLAQIQTTSRKGSS